MSNLRILPKIFNQKSESESFERYFKRDSKSSPLTNILLGLILIIISGTILFINPVRIIDYINKYNVLYNVGELVDIPINEIPIFGIIGDKVTLDDISSIKSLSQVNSSIYKDAKNGDYVLAFSNKQMVIYRLAENKIIYSGFTADKTLENAQKEILDNLISKAKEMGIIKSDSSEIPQIRVITNVDDIKKENPNFFKEVEVGDLEARFPIEKVIMIYRPSTLEIVNSGVFNLNLKF